MYAGRILAVADSNIQANSAFFNNVLGGQNVKANTFDWTVGNWKNAASSFTLSWTTDIVSPLSSTNYFNNIDWFVTSGQVNHSASDIVAISNFLQGGGSLWVVGEGPGYSSINNGSNALLSALGSSMRFSNTSAADVTTFAVDPFTNGLTSYSFGYTGSIIGGNALISGANGGVFVAYENAATPEPSSYALMLIGLLGLVAYGRRQRAQVA